MSTTPVTPLFYQTPVVLNSEEHREWKLRPLPGVGFTRNAHAVLLLAHEFFDAAREFPIVFVRDGDSVTPIAMLGLADQENLFTDNSGRWFARYIPAYIRRYPFILSEPINDQTYLAVDTACEAVVTGAGDGQRLFDENGEMTEALKTIQEFVSQFQDSFNVTRQYTKMLDELGLFREMSLKAIMKSDGAEHSLAGFLIIDEEKLQNLPDEKIVELHKTGALRGIHTHLFSLANVNQLIERQAAKKTAAQKTA